MIYAVKKILIVMLLQVGLMGYCLAQTNVHKLAFRAADTNQDGKITLDEFKQHAKQAAFSSADRNGDGKIDTQEWKQAQPSVNAEQKFAELDKNRDAHVNILEFSDSVDRAKNFDEVFNSLDRNRDGSLSPDEFNARPAFNVLTIKF